MKTAVIIGGSSGIGRALAVALSPDGYRLGVVARRTNLLAQLREELAGPCIIKPTFTGEGTMCTLRGAGDSSRG